VKGSEQEQYLKMVGQNLRRLRKARGFTMEGLAHEADMEYRQLGRIERGEINTSILSLLRVCEALHVDISELFGNRPENPPLTEE
jgi:transcriptional regulator with XRE-family HTH domain